MGSESVRTLNSASTVDRLYETFAQYAGVGEVFCDLCYTPEEVSRITTTPLRRLDTESGRQLLWEEASHWESPAIYKHYLPRLLELLGPPWLVDDLYPLHLSETLLSLGFRTWPPGERSAVLDYLECITPDLHRHSDWGRDQWAQGIAALRRPQAVLPASASEPRGPDA